MALADVGLDQITEMTEKTNRIITQSRVVSDIILIILLISRFSVRLYYFKNQLLHLLKQDCSLHKIFQMEFLFIVREKWSERMKSVNL